MAFRWVRARGRHKRCRGNHPAVIESGARLGNGQERAGRFFLPHLGREERICYAAVWQQEEDAMNPIQAGVQLEQFVTRLVDWAAEALPNFIGAVVLLLAGLWLASFAERTATKLMHRSGHIDPTLSMAIASIIRYALIVVVLVAVLGQLGIQTTSILAALGAIGLAVGLALQGTLSNVAAGFMLLWLRPFRIGDYIDAGGIAGTVKRIGFFSTELHSWDGIFQFVPNSELWNKRVTNFTRLPTRLLELKFGVSYEDDVATAKAVLEDMIRSDSRVLADPTPQVFTYELGGSAVVLAIRVWTRVPDFWATKWALTEAGKLRLEGANISIPYPKRDVHLIGSTAPAAPPQAANPPA
jgi:small conductance mechanosensitive channel